MFEIQVDIDTAAFSRDVDAVVAEEVRPAIADALNQIAFAARDAVREAMLEGFDSPTPFTLEWVRVLTARVSGSGPLDVVVFIMDRQAGYLDLEITPGTRRAGMPATTRRGPLIPGPAAPRDQFGNLPRNYVEEVMREPDVAWVQLRPGAPPTLIRHRPGEEYEVLAVIVEEVRYDTVRLNGTVSVRHRPARLACFLESFRRSSAHCQTSQSGGGASALRRFWSKASPPR